MKSLRAYVGWLKRGDGRAKALCETGVPMWIVHADKGDGGLTEDERRTLEACANARLVNIPGEVFFLPNEVPERVAEVVLDAVSG